ncbi:hypothetical protein [Urbifossiella limnaea]|uniref:Uncharacterized protein n=1 Tax=Urbifossiella limnaea TaxID=2528023 RepID=A0A517Y3D3_9BACT|nr:hypothetical protein [Urbifossiella limnaea]QDU24313.1 hypothetical protein ETAA1_63270 [Urbifossiella limnaea]
MNAHSAARTAGLVLLAGLAAGSVGCKHGRLHARRIVDACLPPAECATPTPSDKSTTPPPAVVTKTAPDLCPAPCPPKAACTDAGCAPSVVEVRDTPPVHIKVPRQDVVVELPPRHAPPPAMTAPPAAPAAMTGGMVPATVNHVPANRARLGFAFDTIRIPFPILRPIAVPTQPEVTMAMAPAQFVQAAPPQFVQPPPPQFVQPAAPPAQLVQPPPQLVQPPPQLVQPPPQLVQPPPQLVQPPPQLVQPPPQLVQPPPQLVQQAPTQYVQPPTQYVQPPTQYVQQAPTQFVQQAPNAAMAPSQQSVDEYCRQVDALMRALEASKRAAGCPPTPGR